MNKTWIISAVVLVTVIIAWAIIGFGNVQSSDVPHANPAVVKVDTVSSDNGWDVYAVADTGLLTVTYQEKYGSKVVVQCKVVFESNEENQFKLIAPNVNRTIEKSNLVSIDVTK